MPKVNIVMYHYVRDLKHSRYPAIKGLDAAMFRQQIEFLAANFTIIRMEELLAALEGEPLPDNAALLTFDDGYADHYATVFPLLDELGLQGCFFPPSRILEQEVLLDVNKIHFTLAAADVQELYPALLSEMRFYHGAEFGIPDPEELILKYAVASRYDSKEVIFIKRMLQTVLPEKLRVIIADKLYRRFVGVDEAVFAKELYCNADQLTAMKRHGMFIGIHGHNHGWLGNMQKAEFEADLAHAVGYMESIGLIDKHAWVLNYPYGSWNSGVVDYIRNNGCVAGLTTEVAIADLRKDDRLSLPRLDTNDFPPKSENYKRIGVAEEVSA